MEALLGSKLSLETLAFIIPGIVIVFVRSKFLNGIFPKSNEAVLPCLVVGMLYYASVGIIVGDLTFGADGRFYKFAWFAQVFVFPAGIGGLFGVIASGNFFGKIGRWLKVPIVTAHPSAWDAVFSNFEEQWVIVTLIDKSKIGGRLTRGSHLSTTETERDIYINEVWKIPTRGGWKRVSDGGMYVVANQIQSIELFKGTNKGS
jgi:Family of unknown function (DUF6338)